MMHGKKGILKQGRIDKFETKGGKVSTTKMSRQNKRLVSSDNLINEYNHYAKTYLINSFTPM